MTHQKPPLVYVLVLNWCGWRDTVSCVDSLYRQRYENYRVLVIDNGSTDGSVEHLQQALPTQPIIENGTNLGFAAGNNVGVEVALASGAEYVWLLNNDATADAGALAAMIHTAETNVRIGAVGSVVCAMDDRAKVLAWGGGRIEFFWGRARHQLRPSRRRRRLDYVTGASLLVRREAIEDVGFLNEDFFMYWEDADFGCRLRDAGWQIAVADDAYVYHHEAGSVGQKSERRDILFNTSATLFFRKHSRFPAIPIIVGAGTRVLKRLAFGDWRRAKAVCVGVLHGLAVNKER